MPKEIGVFYIEILELYYKKYTDTAQTSDYVAWATQCLYMKIKIKEVLNEQDFSKITREVD